MADFFLHPGLVLVLGAFLLPFLKGNARSAAILGVPLLALFCLWRLPEGTLWSLHWLGYDLAPLAIDKLSRLFATIFLLNPCRCLNAGCVRPAMRNLPTRRPWWLPPSMSAASPTSALCC